MSSVTHAQLRIKKETGRLEEIWLTNNGWDRRKVPMITLEEYLTDVARACTKKRFMKCYKGMREEFLYPWAQFADKDFMKVLTTFPWDARRGKLLDVDD